VDIVVTDNQEQERFEAHVDGELAGYAQYKQRPDGIALTHFETLPAYGGRGVASTLAREAIARVRDSDAQVIPLCEFAVSYIREHPEYVDLVVERYRGEVTA